VGHGHHRCPVVVQEALQPCHRLGVEVVGRLVEQQHVRLRQQQLAQCHAAALAAGKLADVGVPRRQAQGVGGDLELAVQLPGASGVDLLLQLALLLHELVHLVVAHGLGKLHRYSLKSSSSFLVAATASSTLPRTSFLGSSCGLLRKETDLDAGLRAGLADIVRIDAGMIRSSDDCPSR